MESQFYVRSGLAAEAVEMFVRADRWDGAARVAAQHLNPEQRAVLFSRRAREFEAAGRLKDAERMFLSIGQHDDAILMYKKVRREKGALSSHSQRAPCGSVLRRSEAAPLPNLSFKSACCAFPFAAASRRCCPPTESSTPSLTRLLLHPSLHPLSFLAAPRV